MKTYQIKLLERREIAQDTYSFHFEKPDDFSYHAGQYISLCVEPPEVAMPGGTMREFSLSSAPYEKELATALRFRESPAKQQFMKVSVEDRIYLQGPFGHFHLEENASSIVFLAGGIGITPILSMVKQALHEKWKNDFYIFFSNRTQDLPFLTELQTIVRHNRNVKLVNTLTLEQPNNWIGETGYINSDMITKLVPRPTEAFYYLCGPQRFIGGMWDVLAALEVSEKQIHGEEFTGY